MATISSLGSGSGLDLNGLLTSLMQAEQRPLTALQTKEASYQARISAYGSLNGALSALQTAASAMVPGKGVSLSEKYQLPSTSVADTSIASASATTSAVTGTYALEVTALANPHRLVSPASTNPAMVASLAAGGNLKIQMGSLSAAPAYGYTPDASKELNVTVAAGSTLENLRDAINKAAADGRVMATIINGTDGKQLVLTSGTSGTAGALKLAGDATLGSGFNFDPSGSASGSGNLSQTAAGAQAATDAAFTLNGIAATSTSNTVAGALDGVTLTLTKKTAALTPTTLTVSKNNTTALTTALNVFIKSYNEASTTMTSLGAYNAETKKGSVLTGNTTLRSAQNQTRDLLFSTTLGDTSAYQRLSDIGVSMGKDGKLSLDNAKLTKAIETDFSSVTSLVSKVGAAFDTSIKTLIGSTGSVTTAADATKRQVADITKQQQKVSDRLVAIEARYRAQFTALDTLIAGMKQTSSYLSTQLANLPKIS